MRRKTEDKIIGFTYAEHLLYDEKKGGKPELLDQIWMMRKARLFLLSSLLHKPAAVY